MSDKAKTILAKLSEPFHANDIEWRAQTSGLDRNNNPYAMVIPYITSRAIMERLDEVVGIDGWHDSYREWKTKGQICSLTLNIDGKEITKEDGADDTNIESTKGGISGALKRVAVKFGIGRYLYTLDAQFAICSTDQKAYPNRATFKKNGSSDVYGSWQTPDLPQHALPSSYIKIKEQKEIQKLMIDGAVDKDQFFEHFGLVDISRIKQDNYEKVVIGLQKAVSRNQETTAYRIDHIINSMHLAPSKKVLDLLLIEAEEKHVECLDMFTDIYTEVLEELNNETT